MANEEPPKMSPEERKQAKKDMKDLQHELREVTARGEAIPPIHEQLNPAEVFIIDCYFDVVNMCCRFMVETATACFMIFVLAFYFLFFLVYKFFGSLAACFYSRRNCCSNTGPRGSGHNPCGPCLGWLIRLIFYVLFGVIGAVAFMFYLCSLGPLRALAMISETYAEEYADSKFSLTLLLEEVEATPSPSGQVHDEELGLEQTRGPSPSKVTAARDAWGQDAPREEMMQPEAVRPFETIDR